MKDKQKEDIGKKMKKEDDKKFDKKYTKLMDKREEIIEHLVDIQLEISEMFYEHEKKIRKSKK